MAERKKKLVGDIRAFGSVTPGKNAFCGDVYELPVGSTSLDDLDELDSVASLYTNTLNVPNQDITQLGRAVTAKTPVAVDTEIRCASDDWLTYLRKVRNLEADLYLESFQNLRE